MTFNKKTSLQTKFIIVLLLASFLVCAVGLTISGMIFSQTNNARYSCLSKTVSETAAAFVDITKLDSYFDRNNTLEYIRVSTGLKDLKESIPDIQAIMVYKMTEDGICTIFDTNSSEILGGFSNTKKYDKSWGKYRSQLLSGEAIEDADILNSGGRMLAYCNPLGAHGDGNIYVCVGVLKSLISSQNQAFVTKAIKIVGVAGLIFYLIILLYVIKKIIIPVKRISTLLHIAANESDSEKIINFAERDIVINNEIENIYISLMKIYTSKIRLDTAVNKAKKESVDTILSLIKRMDNYTASHLDNSLQYIILIVNKMRESEKYKNLISDRDYEDLLLAAPLHDIGKLAIPEHIMGKPGKFNDEEYAIAKKHARLGSKIIEDLYCKNPCEEYLLLAREIALHHHEKWNGAGYPSGLKGEEIPLLVRIVSIADVFDALVSKRVYKQAFSFDESFAIITSERGKSFDPDIVDIVEDLKDEMYKIYSRNIKNQKKEEE